MHSEEAMSRQASEIRKPREDDRPLWDIIFSMSVAPAVLVAYDLKLFPLLKQRPRTLTEICASLGIATRPAEALLSLCASAGLIALRDGRFHLTPLAEDYLLEESPTYFGGYLDLKIKNQALFTHASLKQAVLSDSPRVYGGQGIFEVHDDREDLAAGFTRAMHSTSMGPALCWPDLIDLSANRLMLDIGGGSGAHTIGAVRRWPKLQAIVFERPNVCPVSGEYIAQYGLNERITTACADMWMDPFPSADLHFYSMIYHDWPPDKCRFLTEKSFSSLEPGGRVIIHEMLYNDDKTGPFPAAAFSISMLLMTTGRQYSGKELLGMLGDAGFTDLEVKPAFGYWSLVTGCKPSLPGKA
jgi:SAM-dependent methyltransferase